MNGRLTGCLMGSFSVKQMKESSRGDRQALQFDSLGLAPFNGFTDSQFLFLSVASYLPPP